MSNPPSRPNTRSKTRAEQEAADRKELEDRMASRGDIVSVLFTQFRSCTSLAGSRLDAFRLNLRKKLVNAIEQAESEGKTLPEQAALADQIIPDDMRRIDQCRRSMLHTLERHDRFLDGSRTPGEAEDHLRCARTLTDLANQLGQFDLYLHATQSQFASAVLLMLFELVLRRATDPDQRRRALYEHLIQNPPPGAEELFVVKLLKEFTEDTLAKHTSVMLLILEIFGRMPPALKPRTNIEDDFGTLYARANKRRRDFQHSSSPDDDAMSEDS